MVGAAGAGASAAVLLARAAGADVSGCDPGGVSSYTPPIEAAGIALSWQHDAAHVTTWPRPERLAVTKALTAIDPDNPELAAARAANVPLEPWQQVIADAAFGRQLVGVAGTHGKSTSAGWLVHVLAQAGLDPSAFVGALMPAQLTRGLPSTARIGSGRPFVVEADEYAGNFDPYVPGLAILTSAEWDHPDVFADGAAVVDCFVGWLQRAATPGDKRPPILIANVGNPGVAAVAERLADWPGRIWAATLTDEGPDGRATLSRDLAERFRTVAGLAQPLIGRIAEIGPGGTLLELESTQLSGPLALRIRLPGRHNAANGLGVVGAALNLGVSSAPLRDALATFHGVGRRLERKGEVRGVVVFDDYGHHPTAIRETLTAVRQIEPGKPVWAVYEPLTYHRTAAMIDEFAEALAAADGVAVADIWAGRDQDTTITSAAKLAQAVSERNPAIPVAAPGPVETTAAWLARNVRPGEVVLVMGGGKSYRIAELLLEALRG